MVQVLTVNEFLNEMAKKLDLKLLTPSIPQQGLTKEIVSPQLNRLGLSLTGHFDYFPSERIQVCGMVEHTYLQKMSPKERSERLLKLFSTFPQIPCVVIARDITPLHELVDCCSDFKIPLLQTSLRTSVFITETTVYLEERLAPMMTLHGLLIDVYGIGTLITGEAGIGKSECGLELLKRGHMLVSDDVVELISKPGGMLIGRSKKEIQDFMEVRGLGIINIPTMFGIGSILDRTRVELVIRLEEKEGDDIDRSGLMEGTTMLLGVKLPEITIPVRPGRNLAVLVEIAALNQRLKQKGYYAAEELDKLVIEKLTSQKK